MTGQWVLIQPQDVWMFRDSKPFNAQQNFVARSQFPPNPQTMQGVIRTYYLETQNVDWKAYAAGRERQSIYQAVGHAGFDDRAPTLGDLRITGPFIATSNGNTSQLLVHAPLDLVYNGETQEFRRLSPNTEIGFQTTLPFEGWRPLVSHNQFDQYLNQPEDFKQAEGWLSHNQFDQYLNGKPVDGQLRSKVFDYEDRMGLGMDHQRRGHAEGLLYRARFIRPDDDIGLLVHVNQPIFADAGFIRIGGESRSARYTVLDEFTMPSAPVHQAGRFKVILLTPAYFAEGYQPRGGDWSPWVGEGKLVSAVVDKPLAISGWDVAHNRPKPLRHYVPAGSVYYFEGGQFSGKTFTETPASMADFGAMGFGSIAIGVW